MAEKTEPKVQNYSLKYPVWTCVILFVIATGFRFIDTFVLRFDELLGELIFTKSLGFILVLVWVWLAGNQLDGSLPPAWGNLSNLNLLHLNDNLLTGAIPTQFSSLGNLQYLYLTGNHLSGDIPAEFNGANLPLIALGISSNDCLTAANGFYPVIELGF